MSKTVSEADYEAQEEKELVNAQFRKVMMGLKQQT